MPKALFTSWLLKIPQKLKLMLKTSKMGEMTKIRFTKTPTLIGLGPRKPSMKAVNFFPISYISCKQSGNNSLCHLELKQRYQQRLEKRPPKPNLILLTTSVHQFGQDAIKRYDKLPSQIFLNMKYCSQRP